MENNIIPDIDIDFADSKKAFSIIPHVKASQVQANELVQHNSGIYLNNIPVDTKTGLSAIPYKEAEKRGFFKIDFLSLTLYKNVRDEEHLDMLLDREPMWELLEDEVIVSELFQIKGHFDIVSKIKPKSIEDLALIMALIRPGKKYLINKEMSYIQEHIWDKDKNGFSFKKSHAISYAMVLVVQMNLMLEELSI